MKLGETPFSTFFFLYIFWIQIFTTNGATTGGEPPLELGVHRLWNYVELFWNSLDNAPSSIVFYLEMKVEVEVGVRYTILGPVSPLGNSQRQGDRTRHMKKKIILRRFEFYVGSKIFVIINYRISF